MTDETINQCCRAPCPASRGRNAAATKQAILDAARQCFTQGGYEQVGVREIAAIAGIDPALVNRYFGSKEGLFAAAVKAKFDMSALFAGDRATLGDRLVRAVMKKRTSPGEPDPLVALLRSSSHEVVGTMLRDSMTEGLVRPLAARLDGPDALARAELIVSTLLGLIVYRNVVGGSAAEDVKCQVHLVGPIVQQLIDGECPPVIAPAVVAGNT